MTRLSILVCFLWSVVLSAQATEIYRCERNGVIEFSDQPCQDDDSTPYKSSGTLSVIAPTADLERIQQDNRDWMAAHRARQAEMNQARLNRPGQAPVAIGQEHAVRPWVNNQLWLWPHAQHRPGYQPHPVRPAVPVRQQPYSALSGPFPGTRRRPDPVTQDDRSNDLRR
jgi:hypothetical protein